MIRLINTTTCLPIDRTLEDLFFSIIKPNFLHAVTEQRRENHIDVQFVSKEDLDQDRMRMRTIEDNQYEEDILNMDLLGVYFSHHPDYHRSVIKVSPEKVMAACQQIKIQLEITLPLKDLYPVILHAVVIHELAHSLMDYDSSGNHCNTPWNWLANCLEEDPKRHYLENLDHYFGSHHCHSPNKIAPKLRQWRHIIEESLANAFVLKQSFNSAQLEVLNKFIESQPPAYKAGLKWKSDLPELLETGASWSDFKKDCFRSQWDLLYCETGVKTTLETVVERLKNTESIGSFNFKNEFHQYLVSRVPVWQSEFDVNNEKWVELLNGTFGVLRTLAFDSNSNDSLTKKDYLATRAANLRFMDDQDRYAPEAYHALDEYKKIESKLNVERGDCKKALENERSRLGYYNSRRGCHDPKILEEIERSISEITAMLNP